MFQWKLLFITDLDLTACHRLIRIYWAIFGSYIFKVVYLGAPLICLVDISP